MSKRDKALVAKVEELSKQLKLSSEAIREWGEYAPDYFKEKHGLSKGVEWFERIANEATAFLEALPEPEPENLQKVTGGIDPESIIINHKGDAVIPKKQENGLSDMGNYVESLSKADVKELSEALVNNMLSGVLGSK